MNAKKKKVTVHAAMGHMEVTIDRTGLFLDEAHPDDLSDEVRKEMEVLKNLQIASKGFLEVMHNTPQTSGWLKLCSVLKTALEDEEIRESKQAFEFLELMYEVASDSFFKKDAEDALDPLVRLITGIKLQKTKGYKKGGETNRDRSEAVKKLAVQMDEGFLRTEDGRKRNKARRAALIAERLPTQHIEINGRKVKATMANGKPYSARTIEDWL